jgi:hypothetical protein
MRYLLPLLVALVPACVSPRPAAEIPSMSDAALVNNLADARWRAGATGLSRWKDYRGKLTDELLSRHRSDWPAEIHSAIRHGHVRIGMTQLQVRAAWGSPHDVYRQVTADGEIRAWSYIGQGTVWFGGDGLVGVVEAHR